MKRADIKVGEEYAYSRWEPSSTECSRVAILGFKDTPAVKTATGYTVRRKTTEAEVRFLDSKTPDQVKLIGLRYLRWTWPEEVERQRGVREATAARYARSSARTDAASELRAALTAAMSLEKITVTERFIDEVEIRLAGVDAIRRLTAALTPSEQVQP